MRELCLHARDGSVRARALVDDELYDWLSRWRWSLDSRGYVERKVGPRGSRRKIYLHRQIMGLSPGDGFMVDHINRNALDNRRANLRIASRGDLDNKQNLGLYATNRSGYRGVSRFGTRWRAQATVNYRGHHIGLFDTAEAADAAVRAFRAEHMPFSEDAEQLATAGFTP